MALWRRWLKYAKTRFDMAMRRSSDELDRREAELEVEDAERPWRTSTRDTPTFDEAKGRIEGKPTSSERHGDRDLDIEFEAQQRAADKRLRDIRETLGLDEDPNRPPS